MRQIAYMLIGVLAGFILAGGIFIVTRIPGGKPIALEPVPTKVPLEVHVVGAVVRPGVYSLPEGSRVQDAIDAAGGLLAGTDANNLNLAAKVEDGQQLQIGSVSSVAGAQNPSGQGASPFSVVPSSNPTQGASSSCDPDLYDINSAGDATEITDNVDGISSPDAQKIIDYRDNAYGGTFQNVNEIQSTPGLSPSVFNAIASQITVCP